MSRAVRMLCATLFLGTTTCSLIFSASATIAKAASVHVPPGVTWSAIGFLELLSLAGTMRWLTATTSRGRTHAIVVVAAAALVTGQAGVTFYGWWGALAPLAVVGTIHMVAETLDDLTTTPTVVDQPAEQAEPAELAPAFEPVVEPPTLSVELPDREPTLVDRVRELRDQDPRISERALRDELGVSRHKVRTALIELQSGLSEVAS